MEGAYCRLASGDLLEVLDPRCPTVFDWFKIAFITIVIISITLALKFNKKFLLLIPLAYILFAVFIFTKAFTLVNQGSLMEYEVLGWARDFLLPFHL